MRLKTDYTLTAKIFHWLTALLVIYQLGSGMWMTSAIFDIKLRAIAWKTYQNHKSIGITILLITLLRGIWRVKEKQWEDDERAFKKNIYMIIEALAEDT